MNENECKHSWQIYDSRKLKKYTWRRKECKKCFEKITTFEISEAEYQEYESIKTDIAKIREVFMSLLQASGWESGK